MAEAVQPRVEALRILRGRIDGNRTLDRAFCEPRFMRLQERDRRLVTELVYGVLRHLSELDHALARLSSRPLSRIHPLVRWVVRLGIYQLRFLRTPPYAVVDSAVTHVRQFGQPAAAGFVNGVLRGFLRRPPELPEGEDVAALAIRYSHPEWLVERYCEREGLEAALARLEHNNQPPEPVVWINPSRTSVDSFKDALSRDGIEFEEVAGLPQALTVRSAAFVQHSVYQRGHCYFMDEASQRIVALCSAGQARWMGDLCAAPGSKTFPLAAALGSRSHLVSVDRNRGRLLQMQRRANLYGTRGLALIQGDCTMPVFRPTFDRILLDVPCSGLGTIRANPDIRWTFDPEDLEQMAARQRTLLRAALRLLCPAGQLIYSTCSSEPEENENVVESVAGSDDSVTIEGTYFRNWVGRPEASGLFAAIIRRS